MMLVALGYTLYKSRSRRGQFYQRYGPAIFVAMATVLILVDPFRHILQDVGVWPEGQSQWASNEYRDQCHDETVKCLSVVGWLSTVTATYTGFACLFIGTMWSANILQKFKKIRKEWQKLRAESARRKAAAAAGAV